MSSNQRRAALASLAGLSLAGLLAAGCKEETPARAPAAAAPGQPSVVDTPYVPAAPVAQAGTTAQAGTGAPQAGKPLSTEERITAGKELYQASCQACHRADGTGTRGLFPPLAGSDYLMADEKRAISTVLNGLSGPVTVNGVEYNLQMPAQRNLTDEDLASILTYVRNSWGNKGGPTTPEEVAAVRAASADAR